MIAVTKPRYAYKRLERDEELRGRIRAEQRKRGIGGWFGDEVTTARGTDLDRYAELYGLRRRIIEDIA